MVEKKAVKKTTLNKPTIKTVKKSTENKASMLSVFDINGKVIEEVAVPAAFQKETSEKLLAQYVRVYLANQRQGTQSTKTRSEVIGSTRKVYRQKGTGRARHGAKKGPIFVGGGLIHAPKPRDYSLKMNSKQKKLALLGALTLRFKNNDISVISGLLPIKKTKDVALFLKTFKFDEKNVLCMIPSEKMTDLKLSARNIQAINLCPIQQMNAYEVLKAYKIVILREALDVMNELSN